MAVPAKDIQQRITSLRAVLHLAGVKLTHQRLEVFREVATSESHPDVESVYKKVRKRLPTISLDTVYRTLSLLQRLGAISVLGSPRERLRFDGKTSPHHHFICKKCGSISDFDCAEFDQITIPTAVNRLGTIETAQVEVRGICEKCARKKQKT